MELNRAITSTEVQTAIHDMRKAKMANLLVPTKNPYEVLKKPKVCTDH